MAVDVVRTCSSGRSLPSEEQPTLAASPVRIRIAAARIVLPPAKLSSAMTYAPWCVATLVLINVACGATEPCQDDDPSGPTVGRLTIKVPESLRAGTISVEGDCTDVRCSVSDLIGCAEWRVTLTGVVGSLCTVTLT